MERAKAEGIACDMVVVGEDCALSSHDKTAGRRGLGGTIFIHKVHACIIKKTNFGFGWVKGSRSLMMYFWVVWTTM